MNATYANTTGIPLSLAVYLASDSYDHNDDPYTISVTTLLKPIRPIILGARVPDSLAVVDISGLVPSRMGQSIHDGIERSWLHNYEKALAALGYPKQVISRIRINPKPEEVTEGIIPIYLEQRTSRKLGKWTVTGKFDFVGDGRVEDFKTTSTFTWVNNTKDDDHIMQGSLYRWLNPQIVTQDVMAIQYIFTDWSALRARAEASYPSQRTMQRVLTLKSVHDTEQFAAHKLAQIEALWNVPEDQLPLCTDAELWRSEPQWKYYKNPEKTQRSTKNFDNKQDAYLQLSKDGNVGIVKEVPGQAKACKYCPAFPVCSQAKDLVASGDLQL